VIQDGHPGFQGCSHAHPVYLDQNIVNEIGPEIEIELLVQGVEIGRFIQDVPKWSSLVERFDTTELLLEIIRSQKFMDQVLAMGGYEVEETGKVVEQ